MKELSQKEYPVEGMTCAACAVSIESALKKQAGVSTANVNFAGNTAWIAFEEGKTSAKKLKKAVQKAGYDLLIDEKEKQDQDQKEGLKLLDLKRKVIFSFSLSLPVMIIGMFFPELPNGRWIMLILTFLVMFFAGKGFFIMAWKQLRHFSANMDTLVAMGTGSAFIYSSFNTLFPEYLSSRGLEPYVFFESAAMIIAFILLGRFLEERAKNRSAASIKKLLRLQPNKAHLLVDGKEKDIPIEALEIGDHLRVKPGEQVPVDGMLLDGNSWIDESMISGESVPVEKKQRDEVIGGTVNQSGSFIMSVEKVGEETMLARIIQLVKEAHASKAPAQALADKISSVFVPIVIFIALLSGIFWWILGPDPQLTNALVIFVTVLVIACPCALGLATPTAIMVGVGKGAESGILIKNAESLEQLTEVDTLVVDKTGTITQGKPEVSDCIWAVENESRSHQVNIIQALEERSEHPLARAVIKYFEGIERKEIGVESFEILTGRGMQAKVEGENYWIGNELLIKEKGLRMSHELKAKLIELKEAARTIVLAGSKGEVSCLIGIADKIRPDAPVMIKQLQSKGIEVHMLTGDNAETAAAIAREAGLQIYKSQMLPENKVAYIESLKAEGRKVAMLGDGINDSPALAAAHVGIAMGTGTDIAMDSAKVVLVKGNLLKIPQAFELSRATVQTIRQNLFWAFIYNLIGIPIAAGLLYPINGFLLNPMLAGAAMAFSSVSVVTNSLRLKARQL